jgi:nicotinamide riboside transporter PnuC
MNEQWGIALFGVIAVTLSQDSSPARQRYACLFGLAGQPFWFYAAWQSQQWGIGLLTLLYTLAWSRGVWTQWIKRGNTKTEA